MSDRAVFFDPSRRRWWWIKRIGTLVGLFAVVTVSLWLISLFTVPFLPYPEVLKDSISQPFSRIHLKKRPERYLWKKERTKLLASLAQLNRQKTANAARPPIQTDNVVAAFYAPWQETGLNSLRENAGRMTHLLPSWVHLDDDGKSLDFHDWDPAMVPHNNEVLSIAREHNLNIVPVFSNAEMSDFDPKRAHLLLTDPTKQNAVIFGLRRWLLENRFQGINVDFENLNDADYALMIPFLQRMKAAFPAQLKISADLADTDMTRPLWKPAAAICDFVVLMAYDEHGALSKPGPIASIDWYRGVVRDANAVIPRNKLVIGLANYAYDWQD